MAVSKPETSPVVASSREKTGAVFVPPVLSTPASLTAEAQAEEATASSAATGPELMTVL